MSKPEFLLAGATGHQGQAVVAALFASPAKVSHKRVLALTRSASSPKAIALKERYPEIILVEGNTKAPEQILQTNPNISAIFLVTIPSDEEAQAIPLIDAATQPSSNVRHIVFSSVDRGGEETSWSTSTDVPHFATKHRIELHLREACERAGMHWTILRPTGFMDNYNPGFFGSMMARLWEVGLPSQRKMQLVSTHDIGAVAARALLDPENWAGRAVGLAGDEMTCAEARAVFKRVVGQEMPRTWSLVARAILWWVQEARTSMEWFDRAGYRVDIQALWSEVPEMQTFEQWLGESSEWKSQMG